MKKHIVLYASLCLVFCGCITKYEATDIEAAADILVVEGIITDDESTITLSQSINLMEEGYYTPIYIDNANVSVECDDGTQWQAEPYTPPPYSSSWSRNGQYTIKTGQLNSDRKYRLKIEINEIDYNSSNRIVGPGFPIYTTKTYEYFSDFSYPIQTPEIDSVFWTKRGKGQPVNIHIATHSSDNQVMHYRWSYKEDWEINSDYNLLHSGYPYYCWNSYISKDLLLGSAEKTVFGQVTDKFFETSPSDRRFSVLYRIDVKQNAISKRAYDYLANIKKNAENIGSIFAPVPSELRGNITCTTDPSRPVIGYIDISSTTQTTRYISKSDNLYESDSNCRIISEEILSEMFDGRIPDYYVKISEGYYIEVKCVNCTFYGTTLKPDDWPNGY